MNILHAGENAQHEERAQPQEAEDARGGARAAQHERAQVSSVRCAQAAGGARSQTARLAGE